MKTSAVARSSDDAPLSFNNRMPERSGFGGFFMSGGRRVHVRRSSSQRKPMAFIFSACSGVTSRADEASRRGIGVRCSVLCGSSAATSCTAVQQATAVVQRIFR